jgi:tRNA nucleotidyltransferase (CCA-adding enzyme)
MHDTNVTTLLESRLHAKALELLRKLGELADERGVGAYVVGGVVRDLVLDVGAGFDLDVVVEERGEEFAETAAARLGGSVKAHTRFGTAILVVPGGGKVDVATARSEVYERPGALPVVTPGPIARDLERRDFTINSMAVTINAGDFGRLLDFHGGHADLTKRGILRVLSERSFEDDPTRILRGVRFAARFGFGFEPETERLLRQAVAEDRLSTVSGERIANEIVLILGEPEPWPPVERLATWGILDAIVAGWAVPPEVEATFAEVARLADHVSDDEPGRRAEGETWRVRFLAMLEPSDRGVRNAVLDRLNAGRRMRTLALELARFEDETREIISADVRLQDSTLHRSLSGFSRELLGFCRARWRGTRVAERIGRYVNELAGTATSLTGGDLESLGIPQGPAVGKVLAKLLEARLDGSIGSREDEIELATRLARELDEGNKS